MRFCAMRRHSFIPDCFDLKGSGVACFRGTLLDGPSSTSRRAAKAWHPGVRFHREHGHGEHGHGPYSGPKRRVFTIGVGGPVGSGKTALVERLCRTFYPEFNLAVITNDIYTREDAEFLARRQALPLERIVGVETGGCPHSAIREDASINLAAIVEYER